MKKKKFKSKSKIPIWTAKEPLFYEQGVNENYQKYKDQLEKNGFSDSETFSLDYTLACFLLPRIKRYKELASKNCVTSPEFKKNLSKIIKALELKSKASFDLSEKEYTKMCEGFELLGKEIENLWW